MQSNVRRLSSDDERWKLHAACRPSNHGVGSLEISSHVGLFYPHEDIKGIRVDDRNEAKAICSKCVVKRDCLEYALKYDEEGIWGEMTEQERQQERVRRAIMRAKKTS